MIGLLVTVAVTVLVMTDGSHEVHSWNLAMHISEMPMRELMIYHDIRRHQVSRAEEYLLISDSRIGQSIEHKHARGDLREGTHHQ